jgi:hypothetical protein
MALNPIINKPADQGGDALPTGWDKANAMFAELYGGALNVSAFKNQLINGNFDFWQRGTSLAAGTGIRYLADRFFTSTTGSTAAVSQQAFAAGQTDVPNDPAYFLRNVVASVAGAANFALLSQRIEGARKFGGQTVTLSFCAKADANRTIGFEIVKSYGTTGSPSPSELGLNTKTFALTAAWQKFTYTFTLANNIGKTFTTGDFIGLQWFFDAGANFLARAGIGQQSGTFDIAQVQLEIASTPTNFEFRPPAVELLLCLRYYQKSFDYAVAPANGLQGNILDGRMWSATSAIGCIPLQTRMRNVPAVTFYSPNVGTPTNGQPSTVIGGGWVAMSSTAVFNPREDQISYTSTVTGAAQYNSLYVQGNWTADAEI